MAFLVSPQAAHGARDAVSLDDLGWRPGMGPEEERRWAEAAASPTGALRPVLEAGRPLRRPRRCPETEAAAGNRAYLAALRRLEALARQETIAALPEGGQPVPTTIRTATNASLASRLARAARAPDREPLPSWAAPWAASGRDLAAARVALGLPQRRLAQLAGLSRGYLADLEGGRTRRGDRERSRAARQALVDAARALSTVALERGLLPHREEETP
jgi:hypothetical protein